MGLDWLPLPKPKPGHESEFVRIFRELDDKSGAEYEQLAGQLKAISDAPFTLLGAPRVGFDDTADAWLRGQLERANRLAELDQARTAMHGYYVLALLPPCDGFPHYSNHAVSPNLDRYAFRAQFLDDVEDDLGPELYDRAYKSMLPDEHLSYGEQLLAIATRFARDHHVEAVEQVTVPSFDQASAEHRAHVLFAAAKWCLYWARRGHGLSAWF